MSFRLFIATTLFLLICPNHALNLRGGRAKPDLSQLQDEASKLGANQALAAMGRRVSLQQRIISSMKNLNKQMASLTMKNDQLQRLEAADAIQRLTAQQNRFRAAPPITMYPTIPAISLLHPVLPGAAQHQQSPNSTNPAANPVAWLSYNSFGRSNIPLPQEQMTSYMGGHSLGFPLQRENTIRGVGLPGPSLYPAVAHVPSYPVSMVSAPYFDPRGYPSSILNVPATDTKQAKPQGSGFMTPGYPMQPFVQLAPGYPGGYPLLHPPPRVMMASPYAGTAPAPAFVGGYRALPVDSMGYPLPFPGSASMTPTPSDIDKKGSGSGSG